MSQTTTPRKPRCIFNETELYHIISDDKICAVLKISEKQRQIITAHIAKGFTFRAIGGIYGVTGQRIHTIYLKTIKKIKKQILTILKKQPTPPNAKKK